MKPTSISKRKQTLLQRGEHWTSWEKFRSQGNAALAQLKPGTVGTLSTKHGRFRILTEDDFRHIYGLAREVERLSVSLHVVVAAAQSVEHHRDEPTLKTLTAAVMLLKDISPLPTRDALEPLQPEGFEVDDIDDLDLDAVPRPNLQRAE